MPRRLECQPGQHGLKRLQRGAACFRGRRRRRLPDHRCVGRDRSVLRARKRDPRRRERPRRCRVSRAAQPGRGTTDRRCGAPPRARRAHLYAARSPRRGCARREAAVSATVLPAAPRPLRIVILGLSITSSWGNGHATTYRSLMRALCDRGHEVLFLECDKPWYREHRDLRRLPFGTVRLYDDVAALRRRWQGELADADLVILGSYVPDGIAGAQLIHDVARGVTGFYDIDPPVTLPSLADGSDEDPDQ